MVGFAPLTSLRLKQYYNISVSEIIGQVFDARNMMVAANLQQGRYLTVATICWGQILTKEGEVLSVYQKDSLHFIE